MKEGFATINVGEFETACNTGENTCTINTSGSRGFNCSIPTDDIPYYNISGSNTHSESFDIQVSGCSDIGYQIDPNVAPSALPCQHSGQNYILRGCNHKCSNPGSKTGYNLENINPMYQYISPINEAGELSPVVDIIEGSLGEITCQEGYIRATNTCFNPIDGTINSSSDESSCIGVGGIWYGSDEGNFAGSEGQVVTRGSTNNIKIICQPDMVNYNILGCKPGCISRLTNLGEYINSVDVMMNTQPDGDINKELIQILHRDTPLSNNNTTLMYPNTDIYDITETDISTGQNWNVFGNGRETEFVDINGDNPTQINFSGIVITSPCNDAGGKYNVNGLFPICDDDHECLNFNINYSDISSAPKNINDFKTQMRQNATEIGIQDDDIDSYQNSLYYYRRYKDNSDNINIEGQIRCNNNLDSPFHCEIITDTGEIAVLGQPTEGYTINENSLCTPAEPETDIPGFGNINDAISQCNDLGDSCSGFTFMNNQVDNEGNTLFFIHSTINTIEGSDSDYCYQKTQGQSEETSEETPEIEYQYQFTQSVGESCDDVCGAERTCVTPFINSKIDMRRIVREETDMECGGSGVDDIGQQPSSSPFAPYSPYITTGRPSELLGFDKCYISPEGGYGTGEGQSYSCDNRSDEYKQLLCKCQL